MTSQNTAATAFKAWQDLFRKWSEVWSQAASAASPIPAPQMVNPFLASDLLQGFDPSKMWQQFLQQHFHAWSEYWSKNLSGAPSPEVFRAAEKQWMEQLESTARALSQAMGTEAFSSLLGKSIEQSLVWQDKAAKAIQPQIDAALRAWNLPSRSQIDRLFERVIGLEERLDEMEERSRQLLKRLDGNGASPARKSGAGGSAAKGRASKRAS